MAIGKTNSVAVQPAPSGIVQSTIIAPQFRDPGRDSLMGMFNALCRLNLAILPAPLFVYASSSTPSPSEPLPVPNATTKPVRSSSPAAKPQNMLLHPILLNGSGFNKNEALKHTVLPQMQLRSHLEAGNTAAIECSMEVDAPADLVFSILADPATHAHVFQAIEHADSRLVHEQGPRRKYELNYKARWKFWRVSGVCDNKLFMETDSEKGTVHFKLREPGFLRVYEGTWCITPVGSEARKTPSPTCAGHSPTPAAPKPAWSGLFSGALLASINNPILDLQNRLAGASVQPAPESHAQEPCEAAVACTSGRSLIRVQGMKMSPKIAPPRPLGGLLRGHAAGQVEDMLKGLLAAAQCLQASNSPAGNSVGTPALRRRSSSTGSQSSLTDGSSSSSSGSPCPGSPKVTVGPAGWLRSHMIRVDDGDL